MFTRKLAYGAAASVLALAAASAAFAQEITGGIRGQVTDEAGAPVAGATVTVRHEPTGTTSTTVTSQDGLFTTRNLRVGGPYTISVSAGGFGDEQVQLAAIGVGDPAQVDVMLFSANNSAEIVVTGASRGGLLTSPRTRINAEDIETLPSISRDLKDFARKSPFVVLDQTNNDALVIGGQSNRSNSITVDGVKQTDDFGLQANGYPTQRSPISISAVEALSVEIAPYDVQYGNFQGGTVNVVTKSGGNDFHGELFYEFTDNKYRGDSFTFTNPFTGEKTQRKVTTVFEEKGWGATLSGPILQDRLFFLLNYEKFEATEPALNGPTGSGAANQIPGVTQANVDQVRSIVQSVYGYDPLDWQAGELLTTDEKMFGKVDWNISDDHRAVFSYQNTKGSVLNETGNSTSTTQPSLGLLSKWYELATELTVYKAQLYSDWTPNFSTELSVSRKEVVNESLPLAGSDFAQFRVYLPGTAFTGAGAPVCTAASPCPSIFLGPDISRHANVLTNDVDQLRIKADYTAGAHRLTAGYEREKLEIFNAFVQNANGAYVFNTLTDLQNRNAYSLTYANAASNNKNDGGASFGYTTNTLYVQDQFDATPDLTLRFGLRYDWWTSGDRPKENPAFEAAYGFKNNENLDGMSVLQPRFGFNWTPAADISVYGGIGLFVGGTPNVWLSNNYTNTGNLLGTYNCNRTGTGGNPVCPADSMNNVNGFQVGAGAQAANTASANAGTGVINALDPDFEPAQIWKASIGVQKDFDFGRYGDNWRVRAEYVKSDVEKGLLWQELLAENNIIGATPDGRPIYGPRANRYDLVLTNTNEGGAEQWAFAISKEWREGWAEGLDFDLSYTTVDSEDVNPGTSSVAASNYGQVAVFDPNDPDVATSNYELAFATKLTVGYQRKFFGDNRTSIRLFAQRRAGLPYSYTFDYTGSNSVAAGAPFGENGVFAQRDRSLLYVPMTDSSGNVTATSDPNVTYGGSFNVADFNTFLKERGLIQYAGGAAPRNAFRSPDVNIVDMRIAQEIPAFFPSGAKAELYMDIENLGNLLNEEWGVVQQIGFPYFSNNVVAGVTPGCTGGAGACQYNYTSFTNRAPSAFNTQSLWQIKWGVRFKF
ncbi:MAG TPA: TonB-dependent receptor [Caulobacteraceae bacterium]|nr:TonB-dependent receptor [Caulobacteraceae bacterium]